MPRTGFSDRISPRSEGYLDSVLRAVLNLYRVEPPFEGLDTLIMPKRGSIYTLPATSSRGYLDSVRRATLDLYSTGPPFDGLNAFIMPKTDL